MSNSFKDGLKVDRRQLDIMQFKPKEKPLDVMKLRTNQPKKEVHKIAKTKRRSNSKRLKKLGLLILATGAAYGGIGQWQNNKEVTLEEAKEIGKTVEQLKITQEQENQYEEIKQMLDNESATEYELLASLENFESLNMDMQKTKIANTMNANKEDITLFTEVSTTEKGRTEESITVNGEKYGNSEMSNEMANSIRDLAGLMTYNDQAEQRLISKADLIKYGKKYLDKTSKMAASEIEYENGKIELKPTRVKEVKEAKKEQQKQQEDDFER